MKRRIIINMCALVLLSIAVISALSVYIFYSDTERRLKTDIIADAVYITAGMELTGTEYLYSLQNLKGQETRITLIAPDGTVLYDNFTDAGQMENHLDRPEVLKALKNGSGEAKRLSGTLDTQTFYYAVRLADGKILRLAGDISSVYKIIRDMLPLIFLTVIIVFFIAVLIANIQTKKIITPINSLNIDNPGETPVYDELSPLILKMERQNSLIKSQMDEMRTQQLEFSAITENMAEGFIVVDTKYDVLSYNNAALEMLGVNQVSDKNRNLMVFNRRLSFTEAVKTALSGFTAEQIMEIGVKFYKIIANPVKDGEDIDGAVILILDVTETQTRENLRREFSSNVSHELKTPLTSISGYAEIIRDGIAKIEDTKRFAGKIYDEAQRLVALISDIIRISQLDENESLPEKEDINLYSLCSETAGRLKPNADSRGIVINLNGSHAVIYGIRQVIGEMFYNIIDNAVKYNTDGGTVNIDIEKTGIEVRASVSDTGIGIPEADRERVFERFYRVDKSHSKVMGGTGLGLSIVKHGAALHKARIELESETGRGTKITVIFGG